MSIFDTLGLFRITYTKDPAEAVALGYVWPGTDRRIAGELGRFLGQTQQALSYKSATNNVTREVQGYGGNLLVETQTNERGDRHISIAMKRGNGRYATVRYGHRFDQNWGNAEGLAITPDAWNPEPEIIGGYIFDVVLKLNATQSFISGYEQF